MADCIRPCKGKLIRLDGLLSVERTSAPSSFVGSEWRVKLTYTGGDVVVIDCGALGGADRSQRIYDAIYDAVSKALIGDQP